MVKEPYKPYDTLSKEDLRHKASTAFNDALDALVELNNKVDTRTQYAIGAAMITKATFYATMAITAPTEESIRRGGR